MAISPLLPAVLLATLATLIAGQGNARISSIVTTLADVCLDGASRSDVHQELRNDVQELKRGQDAIKNGHQELRSALQKLQKQLSVLLPNQDDCPAGWSRHEDNCYIIPELTASWLTARRSCAKLDPRARLASVHSESSQRHIESLVADSGTGHSGSWGVWIGLSQLNVDAEWAWSDGTPLDFTDWSDGEPNAPDERCVHHWGPQQPWTGWNDAECSLTMKYLCRIELA